VVRIGSGQPELQAALAAVPTRARAERLRQLALVGLYSLRLAPASGIGVPETGGKRESAVTERRERLLRGLLQNAD